MELQEPQTIPRRPRSLGQDVLIAVAAVVGLGTFCLVWWILGIFVWQTYTSSLETAEGPNTVGLLATKAVEAYRKEQSDHQHALCPSAPHPVPRDLSSVAGKSYPPDKDYTDGPPDAGFRCLGYEGMGSQYYQYDYRSTGPRGSFIVIGKGDIDGDGLTSEFSLEGSVDPSAGSVDLARWMRRVRPTE